MGSNGIQRIAESQLLGAAPPMDLLLYLKVSIYHKGFKLGAGYSSSIIDEICERPS